MIEAGDAVILAARRGQTEGTVLRVSEGPDGNRQARVRWPGYVAWYNVNNLRLVEKE